MATMVGEKRFCAPAAPAVSPPWMTKIEITLKPTPTPSDAA